MVSFKESIILTGAVIHSRKSNYLGKAGTDYSDVSEVSVLFEFTSVDLANAKFNAAFCSTEERGVFESAYVEYALEKGIL